MGGIPQVRVPRAWLPTGRSCPGRRLARVADGRGNTGAQRPGYAPGRVPGHAGPWGRRGRGALRTQDGYTLGDIVSGTRNYLKLIDVVVTPRYGTLPETR